MVAIQQETTVQPGGIIHIHSNQFPAVARAHVIVTIDQPLNDPPRNLASFLGAATGSFKSPAEVDAFLRGARLMGTLIDSSGQTTYLDANILIYFLEGHPAYSSHLLELFQAIDAGKIKAVTSELTLAECLVKPFRDNNLSTQQTYQSFFDPSSNFQTVHISRPILILLPNLRLSQTASSRRHSSRHRSRACLRYFHHQRPTCKTHSGNKYPATFRSHPLI